MLTEVLLEGPMGEKFGREWHLDVASPSEALRLINANKPGVDRWVRDNMQTFNAYRIVCTNCDDHEEAVTEEGFNFQRKVKKMVFIPTIEGAGGVGGIGKILVGAALVVASFYVTDGLSALGLTASAGVTSGISTAMMGIGASLVLSGAAQLISPYPNYLTKSYSFNGPVNTTTQGVPVPLIYGRCMVGSQAISAALSADQMPAMM
ncbi:hypothetical protein [Ferrovum sp.]|uniref:hypothetical protein n=1 Tax=Ferrovum sp. TaxID=2609467 RepID=UPI0026229FC7|nr:hypothetical protein [Ferrovum sp.]